MSSSSAADSMKKAAEEPATDEPSSKKTKLAETSSAANNGIASINNNNNNSKDLDNGNAPDTSKTPSKVQVNGDRQRSDKGSEVDENSDSEVEEVDFALDPVVQKNLEEVEHIQLEICTLNEKASEEILKVEEKYNQLRRPHFEKRNELLKEIPNFWLTSLANHPGIAPLLERPEDEDALHYMENLDVEEFDDIKSGYKLKFYFKKDNPYIENEVIERTFRITNETRDAEAVAAEQTTIAYRLGGRGRNLKALVDDNIARWRRAEGKPNRSDSITSFFAWLVIHPWDEENGPDEISDILRDQIWPNPLEYFFQGPEGLYGINQSGSSDTSSYDEEEDIENIDDEELDDEEEAVIAEGNEYSELDDEDIDDVEEGDDDDDDEEVDDEEIVE